MSTRAAYQRLTAVLFLIFAATGSSAPLLPRYIQQLGADTAQIGLVFAVFQASSLASQYWWGQRSDRLGRRKPLLLIGAGILSVSYVLTAAAPAYSWLFVIRIFEGLAFAAYSTGSLALAGDLVEREAKRGRMMGSYRMFGSLAFAPAALFGGWLADNFGLRAPLLLSAGLFALAFLLITQLHEPPPETVAPTQAAAPVADTPVNTRAVWPFLGLTFAWFFGMGSVVSLWPVYMGGNGYNQTTISGLWALAALGEVPCLYLAGVLADRFGRKWVMISGVVGMALIYIAYTVSTDFVWLLAVQLVVRWPIRAMKPRRSPMRPNSGCGNGAGAWPGCTIRPAVSVGFPVRRWVVGLPSSLVCH